MSESTNPNKYIGLIIGFIAAAFGMYMTISLSFAHKSVFMFLIGTAVSLVAFFRFTNPSFNNFLNTSNTPFSFSDQNQNNNREDSPPGYDIYVNPTYNIIPGNIFNNDK